MKTTQTLNWPALLQLGFSGLMIFALWGIALIILFATLIPALRAGEPASAALLILFFGPVYLGALVFPSAVFSAGRLFGEEPVRPPESHWRTAWWAIPLFIAVVVIGALATQAPGVGGVLLLPFHILAVSLPALFFVSAGVSGFPPFTRQRAWGVFAAGMTLGTFLILIIEAILAVIFIVIIGAVLSTEPGFLDEINNLSDKLLSGPADIEEVFGFLETYLFKPWVIGLGYLYIALLVPLLEEFLKTIGMWFLLRKNLSARAGFAAGMLSGAGFALVESLFQPVEGPEWAGLVTARAWTALIHVFNSGLVGWGLALGFREKRYLRMLGHFALAVAFHGLWNGLTLTAAAAEILPEEPIRWVTTGSAGSLLILTLVLLLLLIRTNRRLRGGPPTSGVGDLLTPPIMQAGTEEMILTSQELPGAESTPGDKK